ncbi:MAG: hypothetical protein ACR2LC_06505 [Pyrinomonadaceae bacterium]
MSEDITRRNLPEASSFEERIFILLNAMNDCLTALEEKVDARLRETRPIWEGVLERLTGIELRLANVEARFTNVEVRLHKIDDQLEAFNDKMDVLNDNTFDIRADHKSLKKRVIKLEGEQLPQQ